jgi:hypothetical protein
MTISVNYKKRKNNILFDKFNSISSIQLENIQNYIPIYERFFSLNMSNYNSINLNHQWSLVDIKQKEENNEHIFTGKIKSIGEPEVIVNKKIFIKLAPLLDPFKYLVGKYNSQDPNLFKLPCPSFQKDDYSSVHSKLLDPNNSSYTDSFFAYLTSLVLHNNQFSHGIDFYGSFLAIKQNYKLNIIDDIDYLVLSDFFINQQNKLFTVEDYTHLLENFNPIPLKPLQIGNSLSSNHSLLSIQTISNTNVDENVNEKIEIKELELVELTNLNINQLNAEQDNNSEYTNKSTTLKSNSTCSSRTSYTNDQDLMDLDTDDINDINDIENKIIDQIDENKDDLESVKTEWEDVDDDNSETCDNSSDYSEEEMLMVNINTFPVQVICMEHCENTLDSLILHNQLSEDEWFSALMQVIMTLLTYQKLFSFTHNDLHTNNIMYISTAQKYLFYVYKKKTYKVPTFGKIYKIIDFGRAIYKLNGKIFCSDSFQLGGDAATQYNTEPYYNDKKPRLEPNFSFDLCRLACSIFDYIVDDFEMIKNKESCTPLVRLILDWCIDDNGINVLYKNNGIERYPDFKLYKMIARFVHNHTPQAQLDRPEFNRYIINNKQIDKSESIMNIDEYPIYI